MEGWGAKEDSCVGGGGVKVETGQGGGGEERNYLECEGVVGKVAMAGKAEGECMGKRKRW